MFMIVAHHYVCNSPLFQAIDSSALNASSLSLYLFGAWGKTGINCFVLITGYFMCKSSISKKKLLKLYLQITFYAVAIYIIFGFTGHENFNIKTFFSRLIPVKSITNNFVGCFILFYLFIPFLNIFLKHITKRQHEYLLFLLVAIYSLLPTFTSIEVRTNYVEWFIVIYFIAAYMRFYGEEFKISHRQWGFLSLASLIISSLSVVGLLYAWKLGYLSVKGPYFLITDSNKLLALITAVATFMWFKDIKLKYLPFINIVGASTFGVLLIHANSSAMRQWLWGELVQPQNQFSSSWLMTIGYAFVTVLIIFTVCSLVEIIRIKLIESHLLNASANLIKTILYRNKNNTIVLD